MQKNKVVEIERAELEAIASLAEGAARVIRELSTRKEMEGNGECRK